MHEHNSGSRARERRKDVRYDLTSLVTWSCGDDVYIGQVIDISMGGMQIRTHHPVSLKGELQFSSLATLTLNITGTVMWISRINSDYKFGVQFNSLTPDQVRYIETNCLMDLS